MHVCVNVCVYVCVYVRVYTYINAETDFFCATHMYQRMIETFSFIHTYQHRNETWICDTHTSTQEWDIFVRVQLSRHATRSHRPWSRQGYARFLLGISGRFFYFLFSGRYFRAEYILAGTQLEVIVHHHDKGMLASSSGLSGRFCSFFFFFW